MAIIINGIISLSLSLSLLNQINSNEDASSSWLAKTTSSIMSSFNAKKEPEGGGNRASAIETATVVTKAEMGSPSSSVTTNYFYTHRGIVMSEKVSLPPSLPPSLHTQTHTHAKMRVGLS